MAQFPKESHRWNLESIQPAPNHRQASMDSSRDRAESIFSMNLSNGSPCCGISATLQFSNVFWIAEWEGWHFALWWYCFGALATALRHFLYHNDHLKDLQRSVWLILVLSVESVAPRRRSLFCALFTNTILRFRPRPIMGICSSLRVGKVCSVQCEFGFQFQDLLQPCADLDRNRSMVYWICMNLPWESQV